MGIAVLKKLNQSLPDPVKQAFAPVIRGKLIYNKVFQTQMDELTQMDSASSAVIEQNQLKKLKDTLIHAYEHTGYYHKLFDDCGFNPYEFSDFSEMERIPLLNKENIAENFEALQADDVSDYYSATTGGSTGAPLEVLLDRDSIYREKAFIYHFWGKHYYDHKSSRVVTFRGLEFHGKLSVVNPLYNELVLNPFMLNKDTFHEYCAKIKKFKADFIHGYPSAIYTFCKWAEQLNENLSGIFKAGFFISENVLEEQKDFIEKILGCKCFAFYGHSERAVFAEQTGGG